MERVGDGVSPTHKNAIKIDRAGIAVFANLFYFYFYSINFSVSL
jgi:hypothetical protein